MYRACSDAVISLQRLTLQSWARSLVVSHGHLYPNSAVRGAHFRPRAKTGIPGIRVFSSLKTLVL